MVENHKHSGILKIRDDQEPLVHLKYPITLETVKNKLNLDLYLDLEDYKADMLCIFENHKLAFGQDDLVEKIESRFNTAVLKVSVPGSSTKV